jgi:hypothetical protein
MTNYFITGRKLYFNKSQGLRMATQCLTRMLSAKLYKDGNLPEVLHKSTNFLCISKGYDIKINYDDPTELTVEHQLRKMFPELVDPSVAHSFR